MSPDFKESCTCTCSSDRIIDKVGVELTKSAAGATAINSEPVIHHGYWILGFISGFTAPQIFMKQSHTYIVCYQLSAHFRISDFTKTFLCAFFLQVLQPEDVYHSQKR